ncbi:ABC transporter ATP-binding protein [Lacticaseibacillus daqingensis]|uniref:ABC transporter ATP-binding protein n=1 Tax=Lacticaseibacillus daqingensis TaxID=2486014 RepID=UPI000F7B852F|nr:ABC transporter ATP-binding protein [Lacticaseibacillus daqingensis]
MIDLQDVALTLAGQPIIAPLNLTLTTGFTAVIGPSGAGKTTLLNLLLGLVPPTQGQITVAGTPVHGVHAHFAYMPQASMLLPWLTVAQNIALVARVTHRPVEPARLAAVLAAAGLTAERDRYPEQLSGGMQQRVAFMRTVMNPAAFRLLDEPFGALDAMTRAQLQDWLLTLPEALQRPTLMVTHDIDEAIYLADRILVLSARPARVVADIAVRPKHRDRTWLATQGALHQRLYALLQSDSVQEVAHAE